MPGSMQTVRHTAFLVSASALGAITVVVGVQTRNARTTGAVGVIGLLLLVSIRPARGLCTRDLGHLRARAYPRRTR